MGEQHRIRRIILENNLLQYDDKICCSKRNKEITQKYVAGSTYSDLAKEYSVSSERIRSITAAYLSVVTKYLIEIGQRDVKELWD